MKSAKNNKQPTKERRDNVLKLLTAGLSPAEISTILKLAPDTVYNDVRIIKTEGGLTEEWRSLYKKKKKAAEALKVKVIQEKIGDLEALGYQIELPYAYSAGTEVWKEPFVGKTIQYGGISDLHFASKYQQLSFLNAAFDYFEKLGIKDVFCTGDILDGYGLYRGHTFEVFKHGADAQVEYAAKVLPKKPGMQIYAIGGSHDHIFYKKLGIDALAHLAALREDFIFLGYNYATVELGGIPIGMIHPSGGVPYARSYRLQKIIEQVAPENKPRVLMCGHLHITNLLPSYRNVVGINMPCFQAQTPYLSAKGLFPEIGFVVVTLTKSNRDTSDGLVKVNIDWHFLYVPVENDY